MLDPDKAPSCPCCGCDRVHTVHIEPPPTQSAIEASIEIPTGYNGMYVERPYRLITIENCAQCGHDMTLERKRLTPTNQDTLNDIKRSFGRLEQ